MTLVPLSYIQKQTRYDISRHETKKFIDKNGNIVYSRRYYLEEWFPSLNRYACKLTSGRKSIEVTGESEESLEIDKVSVNIKIVEELAKTPKYVVIFLEKHFSSYYYADNSDQLGRIFIKVLANRLLDGWYHGTDENDAKKIIDENNYHHAMCFMQNHANGEYEGYAIQEMIEL